MSESTATAAMPADVVAPAPITAPPTALPAMALPGGVALVAGTIGIGDRQLWLDELATWWSATIPAADLGRLLGHTDVVLAPFYLIMRVWVALAGDSAVALRLPGLLAMAGAAVLVAALGRRLFTARVGLIAGVAFALLPSISRYAQEARPYALVVAGAVGATLLLIRASERPTPWRWAGYGLVLAATLGLHVLAAGLLVAHAVWALRHRWLGPFTLAALPAVGVVVGFGVRAYPQRAQVSWIETGWLDLVPMLGELVYSFLLPLPLLALMVMGALRHRRSTPDGVALLATWALAPLGLLYLAHPLVDLFVPRYLLFTLPAWALLAALALDDVAGWAGRSRPRAALAGLAALALIGLGLPGQADARMDPPWLADYRAAAVAVAERAQPGDGIAFDAWPARLSFTYYLRDRAPTDAYLRPPLDRGRYAADECTTMCAGAPPRLWLVTTAPPATPFAGLAAAKAAELQSAYRVATTDAFAHATLVLLTPR